jgi:hypothetical protein
MENTNTNPNGMFDCQSCCQIRCRNCRDNQRCTTQSQWLGEQKTPDIQNTAVTIKE